jgi:hypothetical protein
MKRSQDRILTTHVGSLSRPNDLIALNEARARGESADENTYAAKLAAAVADVVTEQRDIGIDIVNDGEFGKPMSQTYDYGVWWNYAYERLDGFVAAESVPESGHKPSSVANLALTSFAIGATGRSSTSSIKIRSRPASRAAPRAAARAAPCARRRSGTRAKPRSRPTSTTSRPRWRRPAPPRVS